MSPLRIGPLLVAVATLLAAMWLVLRNPSDAVRGARKVVATGGGACALFDDQPMRCWGEGPFTPYGEGSYIPDIRRPQAYANISKRPHATDVAGACTVDARGAVQCNIGYTPQGRECARVESEPELRDVQALAAADRVCVIARRADEPTAVWCHDLRSDHDCAALGARWQQVDGGDPMAIAVGSHDVCAVQRSGAVRCNGHEVVGVEHAVQVAAGLDFACARDLAGVVRCWGNNDEGQLGDGSTASHREARPIALQGRATDLAADGQRACVVRDGEPWCWGLLYPDHFALPKQVALVPQRVATLRDLTSVSLGFGFACGLRSNRTISCWGHDADGALGDGTLLPSAGCHREGISGTSPEREKPGGPSTVRTGAAGDYPRARVPVVVGAVILLVAPFVLCLPHRRARERNLIIGAYVLFAMWIPAALVRTVLAAFATCDYACRGYGCSFARSDFTRFALPLVGPTLALIVVGAVAAWLRDADEATLGRGLRWCAIAIVGVAVPLVVLTMVATQSSGLDGHAEEAVVYLLRDAKLSLLPLLLARFWWTVAWLVFAMAFGWSLEERRGRDSKTAL